MGRNNSDLRHKRNLAIVRKFHELHDQKRIRLDDVLDDLQNNHFFLHKDTIYKLIFYTAEYRDYYEELCSRAASTAKKVRQGSLF